MKHLVYLITGIVLTVVFFVLATGSAFNIYERLYYSQGFNDALYNHNMYPTMALITIAITWGAAAIYYYAINSVKFVSVVSGLESVSVRVPFVAEEQDGDDQQYQHARC